MKMKEEKMQMVISKKKKNIQGIDDQRKNWDSNRPVECIY